MAKEGLLEEVISEQGPGGEGVSQAGNRRGASRAVGPASAKALRQHMGAVATVRALASPLSRWEPCRQLSRQQAPPGLGSSGALSINV